MDYTLWVQRRSQAGNWVDSIGMLDTPENREKAKEHADYEVKAGYNKGARVVLRQDAEVYRGK